MHPCIIPRGLIYLNIIIITNVLFQYITLHHSIITHRRVSHSWKYLSMAIKWDFKPVRHINHYYFKKKQNNGIFFSFAKTLAQQFCKKTFHLTKHDKYNKENALLPYLFSRLINLNKPRNKTIFRIPELNNLAKFLYVLSM